VPQPVALTIPGQYWDVQLYRGVMYLFGRDAVVRVIDWDGLLASWDSDPRLRLALEMSFRESSLAYRLLLADPRLAADAELQSLMTSKFDRLAALHLEVTQEQLEAVTLAISDSPFPFPHADTEIHYGWLMSGSDEGIHAAQLVTRGKTSRRRWISTELTQMWDLPTFGLAASHQDLSFSNSRTLTMMKSETQTPFAAPMVLSSWQPTGFMRAFLVPRSVARA
jgi:hypothetical protein